MNFIYQDEHFFAIDKPAGFFVHPPEASRFPVPPEKICLHILRKTLRREIFPVHRLDAPTSGVMLWAWSRESTKTLSELFMQRQMQKTYLAVVRGHLPAEGSIDLPLQADKDPAPVSALTHYRRLAQIELPQTVGKKYSSSRYSLLEVQPHTGRWHQIRRHFDHIAHPLIGDVEHGDSHHNRFFRDTLAIQGLCLRAVRLRFRHPWMDSEICLEPQLDTKWETILKLFGDNRQL